MKKMPKEFEIDRTGEVEKQRKRATADRSRRRIAIAYCHQAAAQSQLPLSRPEDVVNSAEEPEESIVEVDLQVLIGCK